MSDLLKEALVSVLRESLLGFEPKVNGIVPKANVSLGIFDDCIGKYVIVRDRNEGINFGKVKAVDASGVVLEEAQRIWKVISKDKSLAWYEGVAKTGLCPEKGVISGLVDEKIIISDNFSLTLVNPDVVFQIKGVKPNETTY